MSEETNAVLTKNDLKVLENWQKSAAFDPVVADIIYRLRKAIHNKECVITVMQKEKQWHSYPKEVPSKSDFYTVRCRNNSEGPAYYETVLFFMKKDGTSMSQDVWPTEDEVVEWHELPDEQDKEIPIPIIDYASKIG